MERLNKIVLTALLALSAACSPQPPEEQTDLGEGQKISESGLYPKQARRFKGMAPADGKLRGTTEASAKYDVQLAGKTSAESVLIRGVVLPDGRFESYLSPLDFSPSAIAKERDYYGAVPTEYQRIDGFEVVVDSNSLGFDTKRGIQRQSIEYFNRSQGVFCRGTSPGLLRCLWGTPEARLVLNFHSDHTVSALNYIKQSVFKN